MFGCTGGTIRTGSGKRRRETTATTIFISLDELEPWITRIKEIAAKTKASYVITNNHFRGQAVVNALEMKAILTEDKVDAPAPLFQKYPKLSNSATPEVEGEAELKLFD